jgi:exonuclease VII small subunit
MDNDKIYDLLTKMYSEFNKRFDKIENHQLTLENRFEDTRKVLFDSYTQNAEHLNRIEQKLEDIYKSTEIHDVEIKVIKGGKK